MPPATPNRRRFLQQASIATLSAGAMLPRLTQAAPASNKPRLAVASICFDGFGHEAHEPTFRHAPEVGITDIEFNLWYYDMLTTAYLDGLVERCEKLDLTPVSLQGTSFGGQGGHGLVKDFSHKQWLVMQARRLGCSVVKFTGSRRDTNGGLKHVIDVCQELAPVAEEMGVKVVLENHTGNVLEFAEDYREIFATIDSPAIGMCLDSGHFEGSGVTLKSILDEFRDRILHVDLKDCAAFGEGHNTVVFGEGVTDFDTFLTDLIDGGYRDYLVVEMAWREPRQPLVENLIAARERFAPYAQV